MPVQFDTQIDRLSDGLCNDILAGIMVGEFPRDTALPPETRLARDYGVSRGVVRAALEQLKKSGVITSRQGSGTVVTALDVENIEPAASRSRQQDFRDCTVCRLAIEPEVAAIVAGNLSAVARKFLCGQRAALSNANGIDEFGYSVPDARFHIRLSEFSGNPFFISTMQQMRPHILFAMNVSKTLPKAVRRTHVTCSQREHLHVIAAILDQDPQAARTAMYDHLDRGAKRVLDGFDKAH